MDIFQIIVIVCAAMAAIIKILQGKGFEDWAWPIMSIVWCINSTN
jgi:hypothetical protein